MRVVRLCKTQRIANDLSNFNAIIFNIYCYTHKAFPSNASSACACACARITGGLFPTRIYFEYNNNNFSNTAARVRTKKACGNKQQPYQLGDRKRWREWPRMWRERARQVTQNILAQPFKSHLCVYF